MPEKRYQQLHIVFSGAVRQIPFGIECMPDRIRSIFFWENSIYSKNQKYYNNLAKKKIFQEGVY